MKFNMRGDANHVGPVMLSDVYTSAVGSAKDGVAASQRALYEAYNSLNSRSYQTITNSTYLTSGIVARRYGKVVTVCYGADAKKIISKSWVTIGTLNEEFRPLNNMFFFIRNSYQASGRITTDGAIAYFAETATTSQANFQFQLSYIVE